MVDDPQGRAAPRREFDIKKSLTKSRIGTDLLTALAAAPIQPIFDVIIEINNRFPGGGKDGRRTLLALYGKSHPLEKLPAFERTRMEWALAQPYKLGRVKDPFVPLDSIDIEKSMFSASYLFASLTRETITRLCSASITINERTVPFVYKIWLDHQLKPQIFESARTIKCDAARSTFSANGGGIVWAVADTGIDGTHPHFIKNKSLDLPNGLRHRDFTVPAAAPEALEVSARTDGAGHGTHVAGIIAGETPQSEKLTIRRSKLADDGETIEEADKYNAGPISGIAPHCKILSLKVLDAQSHGSVANLIAAMGYVQQLNEYGRDIKVHGVNMSLGYSFDAEWFAAGQSPLCREVDLLVRTGVVVVIAAGNGGLTSVSTYSGDTAWAAQLGTIADPGNAELAITVGSTHRDSPHTFGISYFSGKGPTSDGRMKPDIVAPGERIVSCEIMAKGKRGTIPFKEDSGTSMAAPHVSGAIAAFLSVRREFIGQPDRIKSILLKSATDLGRRPEFQGAGLVDLMRALQSI